MESRPLTPQERGFLTLLYDALETPYGAILDLQGEDIQRVRSQFYKVRRLAQDDKLTPLVFREVEGQLWIVRGDAAGTAGSGEEPSGNGDGEAVHHQPATKRRRGAVRTVPQAWPDEDNSPTSEEPLTFDGEEK